MAAADSTNLAVATAVSAVATNLAAALVVETENLATSREEDREETSEEEDNPLEIWKSRINRNTSHDKY